MTPIPMAFLMMTLAQNPGGPHHGHGKHDHAGQHGNPRDLEGYVARQESPDRVAWQKPDEVVKALALSPGQTVCDIGAGPGFFSLRLGKAVGESGTVFAVDVEPSILAALRERVEKSGLRNVVPVLALPGDPLLPRASCDLILVVNTYHHFDDRIGYLRRLAASLKPGGRIANVDFHKRELPVGPPPAQKLSREEFLEEAQKAGLKVAATHDFLPHQYFVVLQPK